MMLNSDIDKLEINGIDYVMDKLNELGHYPADRAEALEKYIQEFGTVFIHRNSQREIAITWSISFGCIGEIELLVDGSYFVRLYAEPYPSTAYVNATEHVLPF